MIAVACNCTNHFKCSSISDIYLNLSQVCDGVVSCGDYSDECQPECPPSHFNIFENIHLRIGSYIVGTMSTVLNIISLVRSALKLSEKNTFKTFQNQLCIMMINLGDLCIGIYLIAISYFDHIQKESGDYCQRRFEWYSSMECSFLGVLSTIGSQLSLFSMTMLAISRVTTVGRMVLQDCQTYRSAIKLGILAGGPILASLMIAVPPILPIFEDYFVNGLYYKESPLFLGTVNKHQHLKAFKVYFDGNSSSWSDESSWNQIRSMVADMFSNHTKSEGKHNTYPNCSIGLGSFQQPRVDSKRMSRGRGRW